MALRFDHVGIAVWELPPAVRLWSDLLGGRFRQGSADWAGFAFLQFEYAGGGRIELLSPASDSTGFLVRFLRRHGEGVHHLTFVSDDLRAEVERLRQAGVRIFDEDYSNPHWMEAFLRVDLAGGRLLVQLAESDLTPEEQDRLHGEQSLAGVLRAAAELRPG